MARNSGAYIVAIIAALMFIVGALVLTVIDPVMQALFDSATWSSSTSTGTDLLSWQQTAWRFAAAAMLIAIIMEIWIGTRQPT